MERFTGSGNEWNSILTGLDGPHLLQTWEWSNIKKGVGWEPMPCLWRTALASPQVTAAAMILKRRLPIGGLSAKLSILYCPKGPIMDWGNPPLRNQVLQDLRSITKKQGGIFLKIDPDIILGTGVPGAEDDRPDDTSQDVIKDLSKLGWKTSSDQIQFKNTCSIDLKQTEDELLAAMKQKTRYNIRLAEKKGVSVRSGSTADLPLLYKMYAETSIRDGFVIRDESYYQNVWGRFIAAADSHEEQTSTAAPWAEPLIAVVNGEPIAAVILFFFAKRAYYLYGMSREMHREKMPNYLLQWSAMRRARQVGCTSYDMWGAPDEFVEADPLWNVFRFKEGLGGQVVRTVGALDYAPNPLWYNMYTKLIPRLLDVMRLRGRSQTKRALSERLA
jgi:lipid II:glycine glycyltransferase (peptidoglycan interpeptide bridge formation enzyme)